MDISSRNDVIAIAPHGFTACWREISAGCRYRGRYRTSLSLKQALKKKWLPLLSSNTGVTVAIECRSREKNDIRCQRRI